MNRAFVLLILIHCYPFLLVKSSSSFFDFDKHIFQTPYYTNENFSIGATFNLSSSYKCFYSQCITNLKLTLKNDNKLLMNLWCDLPAVLITKKYEKNEELSCVLNGINGTVGSYRLSAVVQVHTAGSFIPVFSTIFPNDPNANQEWLSKQVVILNSPTDEQQTKQRKKRQDINTDAANIQPIVNQDVSVNNNNVDQTQTMSVNDRTNTVNQPIQLNSYTGTLDSGYTADLTCNGASSCPNYPKTDDQGHAICCFLLPQVSNGITALSSVIYENGAQNLNDFQVNVGNGQSFNAANDLSVFLGQVIPTSQCNVVLPTGSTQSTSAKFRLTWTYHSNSANRNSPPPPLTSTLNDGALPVNVLSVTSTSAFVQQGAQYNEWFVCPPSQDGQISLLRSIALLAGNNIDYLRCIYVNNQGIPLKDPTNGQLLVFSSTKNSASDNPSITILPAVHTDCISIQFFPNAGTSIDLNSILLSITIAFQTVPTSGISSVMPQVSNLQGTAQIQIDISVDISPLYDNNVDNNGQTNVQTLLSPTNDNLPNALSIQCTRYQTDLPMSYDSSVRKYIGTFDIPSDYSQPTIVDSVTVTGSSTIQNPITMLLVDSQGNTLSSSYSLTNGNTLQGGPKISISKIILQATALQDAAMDSTLHVDIVVCPADTTSKDSSPLVPNPSILSPQTYTPVVNGIGSPPISNIAPFQPLQSPSSVSSDATVNCQEKTSSTYGTYPPDLSASTIPTKMSTDQTCFDQISFSTNPFLYDIFISTSDYTNTVDCLSPTSGCSINFANTKQPKITLLFTKPACISHLRIPSSSNVQQFSYSMYDENGLQMPLPGAIDNQGTLLSSYGSDPVVQLNKNTCGYTIMLQLLITRNNGPPVRVNIDTGGCFGDLPTTTTPIAPILQPIAPANAPSPSSQQIPSVAPAPSNMQSIIFAPPPVFVQPPAVQILFAPPFIRAASPPPSLPAPVFNPLPPPPSEDVRASPILSPLPPPPPPLPPPVFVPPPLPSSILQPLPLPILYPAAPAIFPSAPFPYQTIVASPILSPPPPFPPHVFQTMLVSPISYPPPNFVPSLTIISSSILQTPPAPIQSPIMPAQQYSSPVVNPPPMTTSPPFIAVTPSTMSAFLSSSKQPPIQVQPSVPIQTAPMPVPIQIDPPILKISVVPLGQKEVTPAPLSMSTTSMNICPQVSLTSHPSVELIVFSDGTNVTSDLDSDGNGCNLVSSGTTMTVLLRNGMPATFSSVGISSSNVNQIDVALFDELSNSPLIQSPQGTIRSALTLNPSVQNLPENPAATLAVTFLSTIDGQPPKNVKLLVYACFATVTELAPSSTSTSPPTQSAPYPSQYQYPSTGPTNVCINPSQPAQVTSVANTPLPPEYYSSSQCVCICQSGIVIPTTSGVIQYYPSS